MRGEHFNLIAELAQPAHGGNHLVAHVLGVLFGGTAIVIEQRFELVRFCLEAVDELRYPTQQLLALPLSILLRF